MNNSNRIVFGSGARGGHALVPEILEIGWGRFTSADRGHLRPHAHADAFEFCFILSGEVEWCTADSSEVLRSGDVYVTQPDELHWGRDAAMHPCTLYWLILGSQGCGFDWPGLDPELATHLDTRLRDIQVHRIRGTPKLAAAFAESFKEHEDVLDRPEQLILRRGNARAVLHQLLIELVRVCKQPHTMKGSSDECDVPATAARAMKMLRDNAHDPDAVHRVCQSTGYQNLNRQFVDHLGTTVSQYWLRERVRLAREHLSRTDKTITEVATELGFSSSQHFATVFRRITGLTPSEYRDSLPQ